MCDNCKKELHVVEEDFTSEATQIAKFIYEVCDQKSKFTLKMVVKFLSGRTVKSGYRISTNLV